jgi:uncharacterized protein YbcC (UPF0753/DUF2309 family)
MKDISIVNGQEDILEKLTRDQEQLVNTLRKACKKIAPVWPLENFVAVNPYLGFTDKKFESVAQELAAAGGIQMTLPTSFYLQKIREGLIQMDDLSAVLKSRRIYTEAQKFIQGLEKDANNSEETSTFATVADIATQVTNKDWNRFIVGRISTWAASYFDNGQAVWSTADQKAGLFASWRAEALIDRTPELSGLKGFRKFIKALPEQPVEATHYALNQLGISEDGISLYLHRILLRTGGWSAYAARLDWDSELYGGKDGKLIEFLAVLICWEACLFESLRTPELSSKWKSACSMLPHVNVEKDLNQNLINKLILQEAFDAAAQRQLVSKFKGEQKNEEKKTKQAKAQAIFCIDVRSEVYRRNLELSDSQIETLGFAGFFAFPIEYVPIGHDHGEAQCPVLLTTGPKIMEQLPDEDQNKSALNNRILNRQIQQVWKSFKSGAVTCFSFVSPMGLSYLPKIFTDAFGWTRPVPNPNTVGTKGDFSEKKRISLATDQNDPTVGISLDQQIQMAKNALKAMSLDSDFAKFVLITGHGSTMVNNPHATGYDCGACGGHTGEANARVAAAVLNNPKVRTALLEANISIPSNTVFLACLHDTTTDEVSILNEADVPRNRAEDLIDLKKSLAIAGKATRTERSLRLTSGNASQSDKAMMARSKDWAQLRPEWGLAGCSAFVVAPRGRTKGIDLEGKSFLHSYEWRKDNEFSILELIMTAPMVVTSWINLQYYGSTVDNKNFGSGNKTLHNVTAGVGVLEGYSGDLRVGLPLQSIHDGEQFQHDPLRLNVIIEAPIDAMNSILKKHNGVKDLCDNGWIFLMAMNDEGKVSHRYSGNLTWETVLTNAA